MKSIPFKPPAASLPWCILSFCLLGQALGQNVEPEANARELPRIAPTPPAKALATFKLKDGFRIEQAASEPNVIDPIALAFDESARLFVVEMIGYSERREEALDRIRLLEDRDRDGSFETSTVFADGLKWPTGITCYDGGVFVVASPDLLFLKDTDGDGRADLKEVILTGFAKGNPKPNVQALPNSLTWGLDNRIHGATAMNGGQLSCPKRPDLAAINVNGRDFSFDPRGLDFRAESGGGQYGLSFDSLGRKFVCSNSHHIQAVMHAARYTDAATFTPLPNPLVDIATDGAAAEVYRRSGEEPWRVMRTRWRVTGLVSGPVEGGGRSSGYFTSATGLTIFRGSGWPMEFASNVFVADVGSNLVHRKILRRMEGVEWSASRPTDEEKTEFLTSSDNWFRPVYLCHGPDGGLYIADMYREVIEHPWSVPESIKKHLDLNSGNDRGRIYRIVPKGFSSPPPPRLGTASTDTLVRTLAHPNGWHRDTAARLIYTRQDAKAKGALLALARGREAVVARVHALWALQGLAAMEPTLLGELLLDPEPEIRRQAIILCEQASEALSGSATLLAKDPAASVRHQLALSLILVNPANRSQALHDILKQDAGQQWTRAAVFSSAKNQADDLLGRIMTDERFLATPRNQSAAEELARLAGRHNPSKERFLALRALPDRAFAWGMAAAYLGEVKSPAAREGIISNAELKALAAESLPVALDKSLPWPSRLGALRFLALSMTGEELAALANLLDGGESAEVQRAVLACFASSGHPRVAKVTLQHWGKLEPALREEALTLLLARPFWTVDLMEAMSTGQVSWRLLSAGQMAQLKQHKDEQVRTRAEKLILVNSNRGEVLKKYLPSLNMKADSAKGKVTYEQRCAICHSPGGNGQIFGPDAKTFKTGGKERTLVNFLDPNREVPPNFVATIVETKGGQSFAGIVLSEDQSSLILRMPGEDKTFSLSELGEVKKQPQSAMAEGLEAGLSEQDVADLLGYLMEQ